MSIGQNTAAAEKLTALLERMERLLDEIDGLKDSCIPAVMIFSSLRSESGVCATLMLILGCGCTELIDLGGKRMVATPDVKFLYGDVHKIGRPISVEAARVDCIQAQKK